jgi:DNA repair protein RecO (recombination protein O)
MRTIKARGLVLKEYEAGEADKRILLLCKEHGRIMAYARGARKPRSKFLAAAQMFTYADFVLADGRGFFSVTQADVIESFYDLRTDYDILCAAHSIADVCDKTVLENFNCDELLRLVLKSLSVLTKNLFPPKQVVAVFLLRFFDFYGLRPNVPDVVSEPLFWGKEGIQKHGSSGGIRLSEAAVSAISFALNNDLSKAFMFHANSRVADELENAAQVMWNWHFKE